MSMAETMPDDGIERVLQCEQSWVTEMGSQMQHAYTWIKGVIGIYEITDFVEVRWIGLSPNVFYPYGVDQELFQAVKDGDIIRPKEDFDNDPFLVGRFVRRAGSPIFDLYLNGRGARVLVKNTLIP